MAAALEDRPPSVFEMANGLALFQFHWPLFFLEARPAIEAASVSSASPAPGPATARPRGPSLVHRQRTALKSLTIQSSDCPLEVFAFSQLDKAESPRHSRQLVANHHRRCHLKAGIGHKLVEVSVGGAMG
jgi:hypothetical protein